MGFILKKPNKPVPVQEEEPVEEPEPVRQPVRNEPVTRKIPTKDEDMGSQNPEHEFTEEDIEALIDYHLSKVLELRILLRKNVQAN